METPVIVVHGERTGPRLCLTGGVHGDELNGVEVVRRLAWSIEPDELSGTIIAVPIVNLLGFSRGSRYLPDRRDLNRYFPGSRHGSSASRIAHSFFEAVIGHCDALVDFHTGSFERSNLPQVRGDLTNPAVVAFTRGNQVGAAVQIDHLVPLALAWDLGARTWPTDLRTRFANDPANLIAVAGGVNQDKGDSAPGDWMPPNRGFWCQYSVQFVAVLRGYGLPIDERSAQVLREGAATCPVG